MKSTLKKIAIFGGLAASLAFTACNEDSTTSSTTKPNAPTALKANSGADGKSISLKWTASTSTGAKYVVQTLDGTTSLSSDTITATTFVKANLTTPKAYTFKVYALDADKNASETAATITWAPAARYTVKFYETNSDAFGSGASLTATGASKHFVDAYELWDLGLDTRGADTTHCFGSPSKLSYDKASLSTTKKTKIYIHTGAAGNFAGIDEIYDTDIIGFGKDNVTFSEQSVPLNGFTANKGYMIGVKTADNHFAKVFLKAVDGKFLQGTAPDRYIECEVSYQTVVNLPYAK